jgi:hypothetical protein
MTPPRPTAPPADPDLSELPRNVDRSTAAELVTKFFFPVSNRTLERWEIDWRFVNGKGVCDTAKLFAVAQAKLDAAPLIPSVRRRHSQPAEAI